MMRTSFEVQYEHLASLLQKQMQLFQGNFPSNDRRFRQKVNDMRSKLKDLDQIYNRIQSQLRYNKKQKGQNQYDLKNRLKNYEQQKYKMYQIYDRINNKLLEREQQTLMDNYTPQTLNNNYRKAQKNEIQMQNYKKTQQNEEMMVHIEVQAEQTYQITKDTNFELHKQQQTMNNIKDDINIVESELSMVDQLIRIIHNRTMITKVILILLIIFVAIADILILIIKII